MDARTSVPSGTSLERMSVGLRADNDRSDVPLLGLRNFWYPALLSRELRRKPKAVELCGERIALFRSEGRLYGVADLCPHQGVPLSIGWLEFPGTITCRYHGWTFAGATGECVAALNEGPQSKIPGKTCIKTYPVRELGGVIWIWVGEDTPSALEPDIPEIFSHGDAKIFLSYQDWRCNWRATCDNAADRTHIPLVHRSAPAFLFRRVPSWTRCGGVLRDDGKALNLTLPEVGPEQSDYPGLGRWPRNVWWRRLGPVKRSATDPFPGSLYRIQLPGWVCIPFGTWAFYRWPVPLGPDLTRNFVFVGRRVGGSRLQAARWTLKYYLWVYWTQCRMLIGQDEVILRQQAYSAFVPKYGASDEAVIKWQRLAAKVAREGRGVPRRDVND